MVFLVLQKSLLWPFLQSSFPIASLQMKSASNAIGRQFIKKFTDVTHSIQKIITESATSILNTEIII